MDYCFTITNILYELFSAEDLSCIAVVADNKLKIREAGVWHTKTKSCICREIDVDVVVDGCIQYIYVYVCACVHARTHTHAHKY